MGEKGEEEHRTKWGRRKKKDPGVSEYQPRSEYTFGFLVFLCASL